MHYACSRHEKQHLSAETQQKWQSLLQLLETYFNWLIAANTSFPFETKTFNKVCHIADDDAEEKSLRMSPTISRGLTKKNES